MPFQNTKKNRNIADTPVVGSYVMRHLGLPIGVGMLVTVGMGILFGILNGVIVAKLNCGMDNECDPLRSRSHATGHRQLKTCEGERRKSFSL